MRPAVILGIILIVLGGIGLAYQGITYTKKRETIDLGPIEATATEKKTIPIPPIVGGLMLAAGIVLVMSGKRS